MTSGGKANGNGNGNGKRYSEAKKAAVVADLLAGMSERAVAKKHNISRDSVRRYGLEAQVVVPQKAACLDARLELLQTALADAVTDALSVIADESWLRRQDADKLAVLFGVLADKIAVIELVRERRLQRPQPHQLPAPVDVAAVSLDVDVP